MKAPVRPFFDQLWLDYGAYSLAVDHVLSCYPSFKLEVSNSAYFTLQNSSINLDDWILTRNSYLSRYVVCTNDDDLVIATLLLSPAE